MKPMDWPNLPDGLLEVAKAFALSMVSINLNVQYDALVNGCIAGYCAKLEIKQ